MRARARTGLFVAALVAVSTPAVASPYEYLGFDAESSAEASSHVAIGRSAGVLHTNPALLLDVPASLALSVTMIAPSLSVRLAGKPASSDVPISIYDADPGSLAGIRDRALPTVELPSRRASTSVSSPETRAGIGIVGDFGSKRFRAGALLLLPAGGGTAANVTTHYDDERESAFSNRVWMTRFGEWNSIVAFLFGASYRVLPWLDVGASLQFGVSAVARLHVYIPDAAVQDYADSNLDAKVATNFRPVLGARATPLDWLSLGVAWRAESYIAVDGQSSVALWNYHEASSDKTIPKRTTQSFPMALEWQPMEAAVSVGLRGGEVSGQMTATWERWSHYLDEHATRPEDEATGPDPSRFRFHDVVSVATGGAWQFTDWGRAMLGAGYHPSPVPAQVGRTSYADTDLFELSAGERFDFALWDRPIAVVLSVQAWFLAPRTTYKDPSLIPDELPDGARTVASRAPMPEARGLQTNSPGFPGYTVSGHLGAASLGISTPF